jgi:hypothetical protein
MGWVPLEEGEVTFEVRLQLVTLIVAHQARWPGKGAGINKVLGPSIAGLGCEETTFQLVKLLM